jgi:hypothetical protein
VHEFRDGKRTKVRYYKNVPNYYFNGLYFSCTFFKPIPHSIYVVPRNKMKKYIIANGEEVHLENQEFMKKYKVMCDDQVQAREILLLGLMEDIIKLDKIFPSTKYISFRSDGRVCIFIDKFSLRKIISSKISYIFNEEKIKNYAYNIAIKVKQILDIWNVLDLEDNRKEMAIDVKMKKMIKQAEENSTNK